MSERTNDNVDGVVKLVDAEVPADQGLSSLGLLMQLAGNLFAPYAAVLLVTMLFAARMGGGDSNMLWLFLALGLSIGRSLLHRAAGTQLLYGNGMSVDGNTDRFGGIQRYVLFAGTQSLAVGALLAAKFGVPPKAAVAVTVALLLWPVTLFVLFRLPRFARFRTDLPLPEDKGFEGASILMTVLGVCGVLAGGSVLVLLLQLPGKGLMQGPGPLLVLAIAMLVIRSVLHVQAGASGLRETSVDESIERANRYSNFGVISSFCVGGAMLIFMMSLAVNVMALAFISCACWMLMAWPLAIRRFFADRQFADLLAGDAAPLHRRAPDAGLTGLGWLLFAHAMFSAVFVIMQLGMGDVSGVLSNMPMFSAGGFRSVWFSVGLVVLQGWAGFELIRMSAQARTIAIVYGVVGIIVTLYINYPLLQMMKSLRIQETLSMAPTAIALVIPVATLVLVNRKIAPTARARFRKPPATAT